MDSRRALRRLLPTAVATLSLAACTHATTQTAAPAQPQAQPSAPAAPSKSDGAPSFVLRDATVMTAAGDILEQADVWVDRGIIEAVGRDLVVAAGTTEIDARGKVVTPGIIDTHSHIGVYASPGLRAHSDGNEAVGPVTAYADTRSAYWPQDPQIDTARAGGITSMLILPGSANLIGGRAFVVKLIPDARSSEDARFPGAPFSLKMACGENPKRVYGDKGGPQTRMGNVAGYRKAFQEATEYRRKWADYHRDLDKWEAEQGERPTECEGGCKKRASKTGASGKGGGKGGGKSSGSGDTGGKPGKRPDPPNRDFALETLAGVLDGEILVQNHCYRADEMSLMLGLAAEFGFRIRAFHHAVEAYKIADRLAAADTSASVWADWWGFKAEAYDGIRENAAILSAAGGRPVIHSDDPVGIQRLNQEAGKAMFAGRRVGLKITDDEALRWITINAAWTIGVDTMTGSIETGKMADLVVWNTTPFSVYAKAERVFIDGVLVFDRADPTHQPTTDFNLGIDAGRRAGETAR